MINIGTEKFILLLSEIDKFQFVESNEDTKHNRVEMGYRFRDSINKEKVLSYLDIDDTKFNVEDDIDIIEYKKDSYLSDHTDGNLMVTMVMLKDEFEGGVFVLDNEKTNFKSNGDVIKFSGTTSHYLETVTEGFRRIMIIYSIPKSTF